MVKKQPFLVYILAFILVVLAIWALSLSPFFRIREVIIRGDYFSSQSFLAEVLDPERLGNMFLLSTSKLRSNLEKHPWIERAKVNRVLPDSLEVTITETYPVVALATGEGFVLVNDQGMAIAETSQFSRFGVPAMTSDLPIPVTLGEIIRFQDFPQAIQLVSQLQLLGLPFQISEVHFSAHSQVTIYCSGGLEIRWGSLAETEEKLQLLQVIISEEDEDQSSIRMINLSNEAGPVVKYEPM